MPLRCKVFARLNNCANCDEADVSFVQTHKKRKVSNYQSGTILEYWADCKIPNSNNVNVDCKWQKSFENQCCMTSFHTWRLPLITFTFITHCGLACLICPLSLFKSDFVKLTHAFNNQYGDFKNHNMETINNISVIWNLFALVFIAWNPSIIQFIFQQQNN